MAILFFLSSSLFNNKLLKQDGTIFETDERLERTIEPCVNKGQ